MDPVKRQTGQHLEFEPEWEMAFNLQLKLEDNIALFLNWCGSDVSMAFKLPSPRVQSLASPTPDPEVTSLIPALSHTFGEIDHEISTVILLLPADSRRVVVSYK